MISDYFLWFYFKHPIKKQYSLQKYWTLEKKSPLKGQLPILPIQVERTQFNSHCSSDRSQPMVAVFHVLVIQPSCGMLGSSQIESITEKKNPSGVVLMKTNGMAPAESPCRNISRFGVFSPYQSNLTRFYNGGLWENIYVLKHTQMINTLNTKIILHN